MAVGLLLSDLKQLTWTSQHIQLVCRLLFPNQFPRSSLPSQDLCRLVSQNEPGVSNIVVLQLQINSCDVNPPIIIAEDAEGGRLDSIPRWSEFLEQHGFAILEGAEHHDARELHIGTQDIPDRLICLQAIELDRFVVTTDRRMWECSSVKPWLTKCLSRDPVGPRYIAIKQHPQSA